MPSDTRRARWERKAERGNSLSRNQDPGINLQVSLRASP